MGRVGRSPETRPAGKRIRFAETSGLARRQYAVYAVVRAALIASVFQSAS